MDAMLPALSPASVSLADVLPACRAALDGTENPLGLPPMRSVIVVLVDGLGAEALARRSGHARTLASAMAPGDRIVSGFPTTTAAGIASLCTGTGSGSHGLVGYRVLVPGQDRIVNQLSGWDAGMVPETWQRRRTVFEQASDDGVVCTVVGQAKHRRSGFTRAVLRGADYLGVDRLAERVRAAADTAALPGRRITYLYVHELDTVAHASGCEGDRWSQGLEVLDRALASAADRLDGDTGALVLADHGILDVPRDGHILVDTIPGLMTGVRHLAGEPRCLQIHLQAGDAEAVQEAARRWRAELGERAWVATRDEAVAHGWFGAEAEPDVLPRIGDLLVAARGRTAFYDSRSADSRSRAMIGQHGSLTDAETIVPLIRFGAAA